MGPFYFRPIISAIFLGFGLVGFIWAVEQGSTFKKDTVFRGIATNVNTGLFAYAEEHQNVFNPHGDLVSTLTQYFDSNHKLFAEMRSDYPAHFALPNTFFHDFRNGAQDGSRWTPSGLELFTKDHLGAPTRLKTFTHLENRVVGQGFNHFLKTKFTELDDRQIVRVILQLPLRLNEYSFRVRKVETPEPNRLRLKLEADSWFLRLIAPSVTLEYAKAEGRLLRYEGRSNIVDSRGIEQDVIILFHYPDEQKFVRRPSSVKVKSGI